MSRLRIAVIGAGHLGRIHARLLASLDTVELTAVVDPVLRNAQQATSEFGGQAFADHREVSSVADAAVIATPTITHHAVALDLLRDGLHLFVEKPLTSDLAQARELVAAAEARGLSLQVGHVERFNPAFRAAAPYLEYPQYISAERTSGYTFRSTDIGVVHDLMIHDIDLALAVAQSDVERVDALGVSVLGKHEDIAQARLTFANGCVADLTASRVSYTSGRRMQVFSAAGFASLDFSAPSARIVRPSEAIVQGEIDIDRLTPEHKQFIRENLFTEYLHSEDLELVHSNAILDELRDFAASITWNCRPQVDGRQGLHAVEIAEKILTAIAEHRWNTDLRNRFGAFIQPKTNISPNVANPSRRRAA